MCLVPNFTSCMLFPCDSPPPDCTCIHLQACLSLVLYVASVVFFSNLTCVLPACFLDSVCNFFPAFGFCLDSAYLDFPTSKIKVRFLRINISLFSIWVLSFHTIWHVLTFYAFDLTVESIFISWTYAQLLLFLFLFLSLELTSFRLSFHFLKTHHDTAQIPLDREKNNFTSSPKRKLYSPQWLYPLLPILSRRTPRFNRPLTWSYYCVNTLYNCTARVACF